MTSTGGPEAGAAEFDRGIEIIQEALQIDGESAIEAGSIQIKGPDARCGQLSVAEFLASEHGAEQAEVILEAAKPAVEAGSSAEEALLPVLSILAVKDEETGKVVKHNPHMMDEEAKKKVLKPSEAR